MNYWVQGDGPLLVGLPGLDGTGGLFYKQAPTLAARYKLVLTRLPDDGAFTYRDLADRVAAMIQDLGHERAVVLGESFGGTVALWFALLYPGMVDRLVIVNSFPRFRKRTLLNIGLLTTRRAPVWLTWLLRRTGGAIGLVLDGVGREDRRRFFETVRGVSLAGYARRLELIRDLDITGKVSEISAPTLFIAGARDLLVPSSKEAAAMAASMPNATVRIVPGAGHACLLGDRVLISDLLDEWMRKE